MVGSKPYSQTLLQTVKLSRDERTSCLAAASYTEKMLNNNDASARRQRVAIRRTPAPGVGPTGCLHQSGRVARLRR